MSADDTLTSGHSSDSTPTGASASATACASTSSSKQSGDTEYDDEFRHVEKYNIISFSGVL